MRKPDTLARLGGDEFGVLLEDLSHADAAIETADTDLRRAATRVHGRRPAGSARPSASGSPSHLRRATSHEQLLRAADVALYEAKDAGKDRFEVFDAQMLTEVFSRIALKSRSLDAR